MLSEVMKELWVDVQVMHVERRAPRDFMPPTRVK